MSQSRLCLFFGVGLISLRDTPREPSIFGCSPLEQSVYHWTISHYSLETGRGRCGGQFRKQLLDEPRLDSSCVFRIHEIANYCFDLVSERPKDLGNRAAFFRMLEDVTGKVPLAYHTYHPVFIIHDWEAPDFMPGHPKHAAIN